MKINLNHFVFLFVFWLCFNIPIYAFAESISASLDGTVQHVGDEYIQRIKVDYTVGNNATIKCNMQNSTFVNSSDETEFQDISNLKIYDEATAVTYTFSSGADTILDTGLSSRTATKYYQLKLTLTDGFAVGNYTDTIVFNTLSDGGGSNGNLFIAYYVASYCQVDIPIPQLTNRVTADNVFKLNYSQVSQDNMRLEVKSNTKWILSLQPQTTVNSLNQSIKLITSSPNVTTNYIQEYMNLTQYPSMDLAKGTKSVSHHVLLPIAIDISSRLTTPNLVLPAGKYDIPVTFTILPE